jgi:cobaltochelatase CobN
MHLKLASEGTIDDGDVARDLGQEPADIVILSAADSDLATFAAAWRQLPADFPSLRLTNLLALGHPASVDAYVERTLKTAKIVVLRMLGGEAYWPYGVESLRSDAAKRKSLLAVLPGELTWDAPLAARGNVAPEATETLWRYCSEGGVENAIGALKFAAHIIGHGDAPPPPKPMPAAGFWRSPATGPQPNVPIIFYRALAASGDTAPIEALVAALNESGLKPLPIFVTSLKDARSIAFLGTALAAYPPELIVNATAFATATTNDLDGLLSAYDCPVLQVALAGTSIAAWRASPQGLSPRDLAMHVVLPEVDGRIFARAIAFKERMEADASGFAATRLQPVQDRIDSLAELAMAWIRLRRCQPNQRRIGIVLANYPNRDGRLANGVGLDTPQSLVDVLAALRSAGYTIDDAPATSAALMRLLQAGPTNALINRSEREGGVRWPLADYAEAFSCLPKNVRDAVTRRWGAPQDDPHVVGDAFALALHRFGNIIAGIQPARGYNIDPKASYHDPDLVPPHHYLAFYLWLRAAFDAHAIVHLGKHGNLEWLPGKSSGLSEDCFPDAVLGPVPHLYPFIVNDPGEGIQAKRRNVAVIVDHLTPPLARAELHDGLASLEAMVDEYALAADLDPKRADIIAGEILSLAQAQRLDADIDIAPQTPVTEALRALDAHLCDLKEMQIRDGLHVFGATPPDPQTTNLLVSIARVPRSDLHPSDASLHRALAADLELNDFDPLTPHLAEDYRGPQPELLQTMSEQPWRSAGDTVERIEMLASMLVAGEIARPDNLSAAGAVLDWIAGRLRPAIEKSGGAEMQALLNGLAGRFVAPGPAGAPTRGRPDVLPTGRNFFAVDVRAVPSPSAWKIGQLAAERVIESYWQEAGEWPRSIALSAWGTSNMRTGGDDVAQALALIGARPTWEPASGRVTGFTITPLSELKRPRVDVTFRVSGLFRDAFPMQMDLIDSAVRAIAALDEPGEANPLAAHARATAAKLRREGASAVDAERRAATRVFGAKPGAYGAGLQAMIDEQGWSDRGDLAGVYLSWGSYAYGGGAMGAPARDDFVQNLARTDAVVQAQDNREHDILDSDDYYQFMGGLAATVQHLRGAAPKTFHVDTSRPETPIARPLAREISRIVRGRATNPKWIAGVMRHGYKGAFEIAATVDYLFGFAATTDAVGDHHFDQVFAAYVEDDAVRAFMLEANPSAFDETVDRFQEAIRRELWHPRSNSAASTLARLSRHSRNRQGETA